MTFYSEKTGKTYKKACDRATAEWHFGRPISAEHRAAISAANKGRALTPEHKAAISSSKKAYFSENPVAVGNQLGLTRSDETRELMRSKKLDVPKSDEHRASMCTSQQRRWAAIHGEEWAIHWYLANDKTIPEWPADHIKTSTPEGKPLWDAKRAKAIKSYYNANKEN